MKKRVWTHALIWIAVGVSLAIGFAAYHRPALAIDLANRLWSCF